MMKPKRDGYYIQKAMSWMRANRVRNLHAAKALIKSVVSLSKTAKNMKGSIEISGAGEHATFDADTYIWATEVQRGICLLIKAAKLP